MQTHVETTTRFDIAVEDRFLVARLHDWETKLPDGEMLTRLAAVLRSLSPEYTVVCDFTKTREFQVGETNMTSHIADVVRVLLDGDAKILCSAESFPIATRWFGRNAPIWPVRRGGLRLNYRPVRLDLFADADAFDLEEFEVDEAPSQREYELLCDVLFPDGAFASYTAFVNDFHEQFAYTRQPFIGEDAAQLVTARRWLQRFVQSRATHSLLTEYAVRVSPTEVVITPYHTNAANTIGTATSLMVAQPAVLARRTQNLLTDEIRGLEVLVNTPGIHETEIQRYLERHKNILSSLGYRDVFPQVVLERDDGTSLRPDFMLRPLGSDWCDILDIKLPVGRTIVGGRDRKSLAHALTSLVSQLREYSAYFEDPALARKVEKRYGIKCYKPTLIGIIGRDVTGADDRQIRRAMTAYADTKIVTFDELVRVARARILI